MPSSPIEDLFEQSLVGAYDDDLPWNAVYELRTIGTREVFEKAAMWCTLPNPLHRARGADILAQIGRTMETRKNAFPYESFATVSQLLAVETDVQPLASAIYALGHIDNPIAVPLIVRWAAHPNCDVRFAVAFALGSFADDPVSIQQLIVLTQDIDEDVRDWATFGLGVQGDTDTPAIRDALMQRIDDPFEDARMEAFKGLGKRGDARIIPMLLSVLDDNDVDDVAGGYIEAAEQLLEIEGVDCSGWKISDYVNGIRVAILKMEDLANSDSND